LYNTDPSNANGKDAVVRSVLAYRFSFFSPVFLLCFRSQLELEYIRAPHARRFLEKRKFKQLPLKKSIKIIPKLNENVVFSL